VTDRLQVDRPLVVMYRQDNGGGIVCQIWPGETDGHEAYGLIIADLVRHVAKAFDVDEDDVWAWVDRERRKPTTTLTRPS
jgi:hypothetical protein